MATLIVQPQIPLRQTPTPPPSTPTLTLQTTLHSNPVPVPNKHIPVCPTGTPPQRVPETPPASPPSKQLTIQTSSILYPPTSYPIVNEYPPVFSIDAEGAVAALEHISSEQLPEPRQVFPWMHGLHSENHVQLSFFMARRRALRRTPRCVRGITIVKFGGDLSISRLKGAIAPDELLLPFRGGDAEFLEFDPKDGFSVRNFQIQTGKLATVSDVLVYGDESTSREDILGLARQISQAQALFKQRNDPNGLEPSLYHTFVISSSFSDFERNYPSYVAIDSNGQMTGQVMDFFHSERLEMSRMSKATEISKNVWLGPTPDAALDPVQAKRVEEQKFDVLIEASDLAQIPEPQTLDQLRTVISKSGKSQYIEFPSSGSIMPPTWTQAEVDGILDMCKWIYSLTNPPKNEENIDQDGDFAMISEKTMPRKVLIHCADGYTESTMIAVAYFMFAEGLPAHEAWLRLHCEKKRNFFAYPSDVSLLSSIQGRLLQESPRSKEISKMAEPNWFCRMDGSLPSRILPYMYLGNLGHANNPELLRAIGIKRVLSIGEAVSWPLDEQEKWGAANLLYINRVQDNGVDPLTNEFARCLEFIERGKFEGTATLVHCRVGVSRSATICIAEVMKEKKLSFPRAYCFVRARRLNVIIQPHLRFSYELLKWEEFQQERRNLPLRRELEWATIAREIALMNRPYSR